MSFAQTPGGVVMSIHVMRIHMQSFQSHQDLLDCYWHTERQGPWDLLER